MRDTTRNRTDAKWRNGTAQMDEQQGKLLHKKLAKDPHRPRYHFLPPKNWMNDPNGLIHFKGEYHLFYQYNPFGPLSADKHWGHAASKDLVHWKHLPIAFYTDKPYDKDGVFTGCAVNDNGVPTIIYTGVRPQCQCIATSEDMISWTKHPKNPVVPGPPDGIDPNDFRDPYVCGRATGGTWWSVPASGASAE